MTVITALRSNPMGCWGPHPLEPSTHASSVSPTSVSRVAKRKLTEDQSELCVCVRDCVFGGDDRSDVLKFARAV